MLRESYDDVLVVVGVRYFMLFFGSVIVSDIGGVG